MSRYSRDSIQQVLEKAGVRRELVEPTLQQLLKLLQPVDDHVDGRPFVCEAALRFELERSWGG